MLLLQYCSTKAAIIFIDGIVRLYIHCVDEESAYHERRSFRRILTLNTKYLLLMKYYFTDEGLLLTTY